MWWFLVILACTTDATDALGPEGRGARDRLAQAMVARDADTVSAAAQEASRWEGKDQQLDHLLGDALANVLMRPEAGMALLEARPNVGDAQWESAILNGAMRLGQASRLTSVDQLLGRPPVNWDHPVVGQVTVRALVNPEMTHEELQEVLADCRLLDGQPRIGRQAVDLPASDTILQAAQVLGATRLVVGRKARRTDPDPASGRGPYHCESGVLLPEQWPKPMLRSMTVGATDGQTRLYLNIKLQPEGPWAFAGSVAEAGARWASAAIFLADVQGAPDAAEQVRARFGHGMQGKR